MNDEVSKIILVLADGRYDQIKVSEDFSYKLIPYGCWHIVKVYQDGSCWGVATIDSRLSDIAKSTAIVIAAHFDADLIEVPAKDEN